jgi:hypothetical protein
MIGNILIATGAMAPAFGGVLNRFGLPGLYLGEFVGILLMYVGFLQATQTVAQPLVAPAPVAALEKTG